MSSQVASLDEVSINSINIEAASIESSPVDAEINEAVIASALEIMDSPEQMAALSDEDRQRVLEITRNYFGEHRDSDVSETEERSSAGSEATDDNLQSVTQEASLALTMRLLHEELGDAMFADLPRSSLFDIVHSIGKVACANGEPIVELLECSSAANILPRLQAWPACHQQLQDSAASSEFYNLFTASMHELSERAGARDESEGEYRLGQCDICCSEDDSLLWLGGCCQTSVCVFCLHRWLTDHLMEVGAKLGCPGCSAVLTVPQLRHLLSDSAMNRREQLLARQRGGNSSSERDCPRCSCLTQRPSRRMRLRNGRWQKEHGGVTVKCAQCDYVWCFDCHSPAHPGLSCRRFRSGVHLLEDWAKQLEQSGLRKARRCPKCKAMIEKNDGCNHMTCAHCEHEFCYLCSKRWRIPQLKIPYFRWSVFGSHSNRLSVFGCREKFLPNRPRLRRLVRGSLFVLRILGLILVPTVGLSVLLAAAVALVAVAIPLSPVIVAVVVTLTLKSHRVE
ncbi:hypothetical protein BOX15_Mlig029351g1 [Macrostomum lignano]|uniref:Uncharacterized protein n=2 Tax=Macrostomum lignano TaxID=282301 RepID=A0A267FWT6_9PLAT|nr:hypothetical protein BOX15_Mlig029351g3 [Macrostomum lignano]PAA77694.1 hypothetical protein BOX15_Mlig029351g1 [Macrostomum lignano]